MKKLFLSLLFAALTFASFGQQANSDQYIFELISEDSGFTFNEIKSITTDKNNMLWFGCHDGLYYHDTKKITRFKFDPKDESSIPSNNIILVYCDSDGRLWISTDKGICYFNEVNGEFVNVNFNLIGEFQATKLLEHTVGNYIVVIDGKLYTFSRDNLENLCLINISTNANITTICNSENGNLYVGCDDGCTYSLDKSLKNLSLINTNANKSISTICEHDNKIYIGYSNDGIDVANTKGDIMRQYRTDGEKRHKLPSNVVRTIVGRSNGDIWVGTAAGIVVISPDATTTITATTHNRLPRNSIYALHVDKKDALWVGMWAGNIAYYNDANYRFKYSSKNNSHSEQKGVGLVHHFELHDNDSTIWVANEWSGFGLYNFMDSKYIEDYRPDLHVKTLKRDKNGNLWIGTIGQGLYYMDTKSKKISKIDIPKVFGRNTVIPAIEIDDRNHELWIGSRGNGVLRYNIDTKEFTHYDIKTEKRLPTNAIWAIKLIGNDLAICSDDGLIIRDGDSGNFSLHLFQNDDLFDNSCYSLYHDIKTNNIYVCTKEYGVQIFDINSRQFQPLDYNDILDEYQIYNIIKDSKDQLWISSNNGIYQCSPLNNKLKHFSKSDGLHNLRFHPASCAITKDDILFFGSIDGFYYIDTNLIKSDDQKYGAFISSISINGESLSPHNCIYQDSYLLTNISQLKLPTKNNTISFNVVTNNVLKSDNYTFRYRLIGYLDNWTECDNTKDIVYTRLPFGRYQFEVQARNSNGTWSDSCIVDIKIETPLMLKWYAILLYLIILTLITIYIIREAAFKIQVKRDIEIEREINIINNRSFEEKVKFFMNISHELRTPLSLIHAPLNLLRQETHSKESLLHISAIKRNTDRLLRLTNQILDFRLLEVGKLKAAMSRCNVVRLCSETHEYFEYQIKDRQINFSFESSDNPIYASIDEDLIGKVIYNLLNNALKYSAEGSSVSMKIESRNVDTRELPFDTMTGCDFEGDAIIISIADAGIGIKAENLPHIFKRFYFNQNDAFSSSGIGLHMCMEYINLHNGKILVQSEVQRGTTFTVAIPTNCDKGCANEQADVISTNPYKIEESGNDSASAESKNQHKSTILIVDDNSEIRFYLKKMLGRSYNCVTAKNGQQGLDMAIEVSPQLIIMDVLMPIMGGVECVTKLRDNDSTKLIPIIMLTGLTDDNTLIQGVKSGVDAYLAKPINETLLFVHVEKLLSRNTLFSSAISNSKANSVSNMSSPSFIENIENIIEQNLQNNTMDVNFIAHQMQVSRSTLQRNFKNEIDMGVAEFIRDYRLRSAVKLMESGIYNIDEISICVGFNSSSYFCKAFKYKYGETPKKYYETLKGNK
ncbi:MAG: two-component regulator propeller domain-containing protein [Rikenellaceae bacterium]